MGKVRKMIPSEYETIIQMLLNEVIRLRRESDNTFRNALAEASFRSRMNPTTGTTAFLETPKLMTREEKAKEGRTISHAPVPKKNRIIRKFDDILGPRTKAANQFGHKDETGTWIPNKIKTPKRGKGGKFVRER